MRNAAFLGMIATLACAVTADARVIPASLKPQVGLGYQPADRDEKGLWQDCDHIEQEIASSNLRVRDPPLQAYLEGILARLLGPQVKDVRVYIVHDPSFNASMFPNGMTLVHTGLLARMHNEGELAAVLGHEAGHYLLRHQITNWRDLKTRSGVMAFVSAGAMLGAGISAQAGTNPNSWIDLANSINTSLALSFFTFSREQESEADAYGLKLLAEAGYPSQSAADVWRSLIAERRASAAARDKKYRDSSRSAFSTHPASEERLTDLDLSAREIDAVVPTLPRDSRAASWQQVVLPIEGDLLNEQIKRNDPGASLFIIEGLAKNGWTGLLRFYEGEVYRLRDTPGDAARATDAYAAAVQMPDAPAEAWRQHGYALIKSGQADAGRDALRHYLALKPSAPDAAMVRFSLTS